MNLRNRAAEQILSQYDYHKRVIHIKKLAWTHL